jgi:hypothetical protein
MSVKGHQIEVEGWQQSDWQRSAAVEAGDCPRFPDGVKNDGDGAHYF